MAISAQRASTSLYDSETKAQALALLRQGVTVPHIAGQLSIPERTLQNWAQRWRQMAPEEDRELIDEEYRISRRGMGLLHKLMDCWEEMPDGLMVMFAKEINAVTQTAADKIIRSREASKPPPDHTTFIIFEQHQLDTALDTDIEATAHD